MLEALTYRYRGHSMSDPAKYRSREEVARVRSERDPIEHVRELLLEGKHTDEDTLKEIEKEVRAVINEAAEYAQNNPEPDPAELHADVYVG